jgi:1-acyl-sn-glycerol-3-phosphate acyltransferase
MIGWLCYGFLYILLHGCRAIGWFRWKAEGVEQLPPREAGGVLIAMNHVHYMDIPVIGAMLPFSYRLSWVAKSELLANPLLGWWFRQMQVIPIRRGKRDLNALEESARALRAGAVLLIFPEGTRGKTGVLREGRGGAVRLAMQAGVPIVPVAIMGTEHGLKGTLTRKPVLLRMGKPYTVGPTPDGKIPPELMEQLTNEMMFRIAELLPPERRGAYAQLPAPTAPGPAITG